MANIVEDDKRYINASHLAVLTRLVLFPNAPLRLELLNEYISVDFKNNIRCLGELQKTFPFIDIKYTWNEKDISEALDIQIISDIINNIETKQPKTEIYKQRLNQLKNGNLLGAEICIKESKLDDVKKWLDAYLENYKNGLLKSLENTYKFDYNLKKFLQYLDKTHYELSSFNLKSSDNDLEIYKNKILETILYLNKRKQLTISYFEIIKAGDDRLKEDSYEIDKSGDEVLSDNYLNWACTLEFKDLLEDIWRQETIKRDLNFTKNEWAVLENIMLSEKEIGAKIGKTPREVNTYKKSLFKKLNVHKKRDAYSYFEKKGHRYKD